MRRYITIMLMILLSTIVAQGQIKIGGNVYGGGNHAEVKGSTKVTVKAGDIGYTDEPIANRPLEDPKGKVFGGARMANVGGHTFVHIDGKSDVATGTPNYILINQVYGGNDIAGTIGTAKAVKESRPAELTAVMPSPLPEGKTKADYPKLNDVDDTFNSYVRVSTKTLDPENAASYYTAAEIAAAANDPEAAAYGKKTTDIKPDPTARKVYIGQLFAGGNGDFDYEQTTLDNGKVSHVIYNWWDTEHKTPLAQVTTAAGEVGFQMPELDKTYLEVVGGSIVYAYGGGNNATIREQNIIHIDNPSAVVNHIKVDATGKEDANGTDLLSTVRFKEMGINTTFSQPSSGEYQVGRFFGGNNKAEMHIRPTWNLLAGKVRNLYSGGNKGKMTSSEGLLLEIKDYSSLIVDNLYGGCRMADVMPTVNGEYRACTNLPGYKFPDYLSARTLVRGGHIHNVYGGNDVTGSVYGGNAIGIYTTVYGDVYGGGNGAYPYTDQEDLQNDETYGDFYYNPGNNSINALNSFRPNAEQVSIRLKGTAPASEEDRPTYTVIQGSVFLGGNCATLVTKERNPRVELKIGSYVIADNVFLGNNGEKMIDETYLKKYDEATFSNLNLKDPVTFAGYMDGVSMSLKPNIVFDKMLNGDPADYEPFTSFIGSFYCGGNVGSMTIEGKEIFTINQGVNIYEKFVGGCNNAYVKAGPYNAAYQGGVIGTAAEQKENGYMQGGKIKDRIEINLENLTITPLRWNDNKTMLLWNTQKWGDVYTAVESGTTLTDGEKYYTSNRGAGEFTSDGTERADGTNYFIKEEEQGFYEVPRDPADKNIRLLGGNVYGGCYESGHVNGNVIININEELLNKDNVFGTKENAVFGNPASGVKLEDQRDDLMAVALSVFGAGYGEETEIWGSTTVNHNNGYAFQIYGGGQSGVVGKKVNVTGEGGVITQEYQFNPAYSSTVNLKGQEPVYRSDGTADNSAETEYLYGGGNEGDVCGNTLVNLGNGRVYDAFGGASDADILGHAEVYIGRQPNSSGGYSDGFPWIKDIVYGGNDFGGTIWGEYEDGYNFEARLRNAADMSQLHGYKANTVPDVLKGSTYVEYLIGRVDTIFGGGYGSYDYSNETLYGTGVGMPKQHSSFVNIRPNANERNALKAVFGGGTGFPGNRNDDKAQDRSYVLIDIPDGNAKFANLEAFGAGSYNGLGMNYTKNQTFADDFNLDEASAIVDLLHGRIKNAFGGSYQEGVTRRTVVNVPANSSIQIDSIFGGAYGKYILPPCDVYETQVNYKNTSEKAQVFGAIFGGNNNERRSLFTQVNISSPVYTNKEKGYTGTVYGAGRGIDTWSEHTEVNLFKGAKVYEVYGGGEMGHVLNSASVEAYMKLYRNEPSPQIGDQDDYWKKNKDNLTSEVEATREAALDRWKKDWKAAWTIDGYYNPNETWTDYANNAATNLEHVSDRAELDDKTAAQLDGAKKHNTNVIVDKGAVVDGYVYGGGLGDAKVALTGDVYGTTYVAVLGGEVKKDVYAGGRAGGLDNLFGADDFADPGNRFVASANVYVQGGTARNVYGGGYEGHVGHHEGAISAAYTGDRLARANVAIGKAGTNTFDGGAPAITRNVYGGGEGGSVYGTSHVTLNNGYIGYRYENTGTESKPKYEYVEELKDKEPGDLDLSGNVFGGGYVINSYVDNTNIDMYGGKVRGSLYGGGEVGPIGRGANKTGLEKGGIENGDATIFRAGTTQVNMYDGYVLRNVFGGGRGKDSWGGDGTMYMDKTVVESLKTDGLFCKGYIFGQTRVNIHGGEIGTDEGMLKGYGNVFGGCDEGTVYSAYMDGDNLRIGKKAGVRYNDGLETSDPDYDYEGYYYQYNGSNFLTKTDGKTRIFTEDCKVVVEPHTQAYFDVNIPGGKGSPRGDGDYKAGEYVTTSDLNLLKNKTAGALYWNNLDPDGIIIHNAVFAGGNIAAGSSSLYANATTVYGNATASIHDAYNRDLITIGTGHTGGLYGDGNLTFVDGYRELNITNYGTDYYHIDKQLDYEVYKDLPEREKAYYELKYKCLKSCTDIEGTTYSEGSNLPMDELLALFTKPDGTSVQDGTNNIIVTEGGKKVPNSTYWQENGVVSIYAGRIMNTIQRADFCGVFGSRMVMKGAQDRVPEIADYTNYTINRVREVSLNKKNSKAGDTGDNAIHGNYFGIYSNVNYLGALTSDVRMDTLRTTNADLVHYPELTPASSTQTFSQWKEAHKDEKTRNNGTCHNHLALASGVYLELTTEKSTGNTLETKDWGLITGVIELDLINVQTGIGGGFVYARNEHGVPSPGISNATLTALNDGAASKWNYKYDNTFNNWEESDADGDDHKKEWQTSGNFIHSSQTIIDDCYNVGSRYKGKYGKYGDSAGVPAHYWYIAGSVYVYDQYISAFTGSPNAFSETVEVPITINAASHGTMTLMDVQPNLYAYYSTYTDASNNTPLSGEQKLVINNVIYHLNDPISYWDWNKLPAAEKKLFVSDTYIVNENCKIGSTDYTAGTVLLKNQYEALISKDSEDNPVYPTVTHKRLVDGVEQDVAVPFTEVFRSSNNMSHTTGYLLTYNVTNPKVWDKWYTKVQDDVVDGQNVLVKKQTDGTGFEDGPTYYPTTTGLYGQLTYDVNAIISKFEYDKYNGFDYNDDKDYVDADDVLGLKQMYPAVSSRTDQAEFVPAHLVTKEYSSGSVHYYPGAPVAAEISGFTSPAYVSTATIQLSSTKYIYVNDLMTADEMDDFKEAYPSVAADIEKLVVPAYYCTTAGLYGGSYYEDNKNYRALEAYSSMSPTDRLNFNFNYDALDLLIDPTYGGTVGQKYQYDSADADLEGAQANAAHYSLVTPIDYTATYRGDATTDEEYDGGMAMYYYTADAPATKKYVKVGTELTSTVYETLPNEQHHYAPINVDKAGDYYIVKESFVHGETPYAVGTTIDSGTFDRLTNSEKKNYIDKLTFTADDVKLDGSSKPIPYYYCRESYTVNEHGEGKPVTLKGGTTPTYTSGNTVPVGTLIDATCYSALPNRQKNFVIHGVSPMETSTLYVARNADINDLSTEKIITVIYKYDYEESDKDGTHITPVSERHVVNIHINFKSGVPTVEDINAPTIVLPGTGITMRVPSVKPGAYEITGGGWELFEKPSDAESHINGVPYTPSEDPLYWYQDGFYLAYYAKTYLGKTYSNHVPVSVANYHDLKQVMDDKVNHLHVDYDRTRLKRDSKIYINDYSGSSQNGLDLFKDLYDLSLLTTAPTTGDHLEGHSLLNNSTEEVTLSDGSKVKRGVKGGENLEFFLRTDIDHSSSSWSTIGTDAVCFKGNLHGDGHTISGLDHSLFYNLCGSVYNLGVTGSFQTAGVADKGTGYVESAWVKTSATTPLGSKPNAVFGNPSDDKGYQLVNSYFWNGNKKLYANITGDDTDVLDYKETITSGGARGVATAKSDTAFYNGELAYDLNNFYLHKRYANNKGVKDESNLYDRYFTIGDDGKLVVQPYKSYENRADLCSSGYTYIPDGKTSSVTLKYVEERFADGDFRFDGGDHGVIPDTEDERFFSWTVTDPVSGKESVESGFFPIYPDDYIFFGQKLTYGYNAHAHQNVPTAVVRDGGRLSYGDNANRVYRAPAYYGSNEMGVAHFNPTVYLAQQSSDGTKDAYPGMTAIDYAGHYDTDYILGQAYRNVQNWTSTKNANQQAFYPPLLDDDGLTSIENCDETQNLLVYAPAASGKSGYVNAKTHGVLTSYFADPVYNDYYDVEGSRYADGKQYRRVEDATAASVNGHLVQSNLVAINDHLLVDKQDFNCPIAYDFDAEHLMWYQRKPADGKYVDLTKGWQGISVPFTAELVTTNQKGEITHFYNDDGENSKGHEYWLRELTDGGTMSEKSTNVLEADFHYLRAAGDKKTVGNTFLWDYYYEKTERKDKNDDKYQRYYDTSRTYENYPLLTAAKPYILGLPGETYYEFDLSGNFGAENTKVSIPKLGKQTITFASNKREHIGMSDDEMTGTRVTYGGNNYYFKPSYMNKSLAADGGNYALNDAGNSYVKVTGAAKIVSAFRPYFTGPAVASSRKFVPESIVFGGDYNGLEQEPISTLDGGLEIYVKDHRIIATSHLKEPVTICIMNVGGITLANYVLQPGETQETRVQNTGVYIVNKKKLFVK